MDSLKKMYTPKQVQVLKDVVQEEPVISIFSGAKRAGKTYVLIILFAMMVAKQKNKQLNFIIGGSSLSSIRRNILNDLEIFLGIEIKLNKNNGFKLFGNMVYCFGGANADSYKTVRGFTVHSSLINEATTLHETFIKEVISRCSMDGSQILMDTNTENPLHKVKVDYIDNAGQRLESGRLNVYHMQFTLDDNTFLNQDYIESIKQNTPSGMFYDRDILGMWVNGEGVVYKDFRLDKHIVSKDKIPRNDIVKYFCGVDWGYEHYGSILVLGKTYDNNVYLIEEHAYQHLDIDEWVEIALDIKNRYNNPVMWCDSAYPMYINKFQSNGIKARKAKKDIMPGIAEVGKMFKTDRLFIVDNAERFKQEIVMYSYDNNGNIIKKWDDVLNCWVHHKKIA